MRRFPKVRDGVFRLVFLVFVIYRFSVSYVRLRWRARMKLWLSILS